MGSPIEPVIVSEAEVLEEIEEAVEEILTLRDRCDATANGVEAAKVAVWFTPESEPLLFCHHHWVKHEESILARSPFRIHDQRPTEVVNRQQGNYIG